MAEDTNYKFDRRSAMTWPPVTSAAKIIKKRPEILRVHCLSRSDDYNAAVCERVLHYFTVCGLFSAHY